MSVRWTLGIKCERCPNTYGAVVLDTHVHYGHTLDVIRAEAAPQGWTHHHGHRRRSIDLCPGCTTARKVSFE